jgi:hypothetical protein
MRVGWSESTCHCNPRHPQHHTSLRASAKLRCLVPDPKPAQLVKGPWETHPVQSIHSVMPERNEINNVGVIHVNQPLENLDKCFLKKNKCS